MSGNLAPLPVWQFVDQNGHPIAGGSVAWYQAGTQTKVTIYSDLALDTPLPNPVPLDAAGRPTTASGPTPMFFDPSRAYKQILLDATGQVVWTADNIVSPGTGIPGPQGPPGAGILNANYDEGDWTPVLAALDNSAVTGVAYSEQRGHWARIGRLVFVTGRVSLSQLGTWTADPVVVIAGLPFTVATAGPADDLSVGAVVMTFFRNLANTDYRSLYGTAEAIPSALALMGLFAPFNLIEWLHPHDLTDTTDFAFTGFYQTSDPGPGGGGGLGDEVTIGDGTDTIALQSGSATHLVNCTNTADLHLTTITMAPNAPQVGERLIIQAQGGGVVYLPYGDINASFVNDVGSGPTPLLFGTAEYIYSSLWGNRWRLVAHRQHFPISSPFNAANYYGDQANDFTWTVAPEHVRYQTWELSGNRIRVWIELVGTAIAGSGAASPMARLVIQNPVWGGYLGMAQWQFAGVVVLNDAGGGNVGAAYLSVQDRVVITPTTRPMIGSVLDVWATLEFEVQ